MGSVSAFPFVHRLICLNGAVLNEFGQRKYHVGKKIAGDETQAVELLFSDETLKADDTAFWMKIKDVVRATVSQVQFDKILERLRESAQQKIEGAPEKVVLELANKHQLNEGQRTSILRHLIDDGVGLNAFGLMQAVSSAADEEADYDTNTRLQQISGGVITLNPSQWKELATAA